MLDILTVLLTNPIMAVVVVLVAVAISKLLKVSFKIIKWIILIGLAYILVTSIGLF